MRHTLAAVAAAAVTVTSGCADPYAGSGSRSPAVPGEIQGTIPSPQRESSNRPLPTPDAVLRRAADLTTNWHAGSVAGRYVQLARMSVGQAHRDALDAAARLPTDPQLRDADTRSTGRVVGVLPQGRNRFAVVTHESLLTDGLTTRRWRVIVAAVRREPGGYALSAWKPQP